MLSESSPPFFFFFFCGYIMMTQMVYHKKMKSVCSVNPIPFFNIFFYITMAQMVYGNKSEKHCCFTICPQLVETPCEDASWPDKVVSVQMLPFLQAL